MKKIILVLTSFLGFNVFSQSDCQNALPFCTGMSYTDSTYYVNNTTTGVGLSFGCIASSPRVCFFYGQALNNGPITIQAVGTGDIDLIIWGGVSSPTEMCNQQVNQVLGCNYSTNSTESLSFLATSGQYYLIAVTNPISTTVPFTLSQTAGSGSLCINACSRPVVAPTICYVTSNNNLNNEIYFNNYTSTFKKGTVIYRENSSSLWDSIGYVPSGQPDKFIDLTSNTNQQAYRYAIAHLDSCNNIQPKSNIHKTILLQSSLGTGTQINLSWNLYQGINVSSYYIFRGTSTSNMQIINTVSGSTSAYTDLTPPTGLNYYKIAILTPTNCTSSASALDTIISSNYKTNQNVGITESELNNQINVFPNPATNNIYINSYIIPEKVSIMDLTGKELLIKEPKSGNEIISVEDLSSGVYFVRISINHSMFYRKIIVDNGKN